MSGTVKPAGGLLSRLGWTLIVFVVLDVLPESENKETCDNKEVKANADKDEESENDDQPVGDC